MRKGTMLVVIALDERTVVLRSRAGRYRLGAWSKGTSAIHPSAWAAA